MPSNVWKSFPKIFQRYSLQFCYMHECKNSCTCGGSRISQNSQNDQHGKQEKNQKSKHIVSTEIKVKQGLTWTNMFQVRSFLRFYAPTDRFTYIVFFKKKKKFIAFIIFLREQKSKK